MSLRSSLRVATELQVALPKARNTQLSEAVSATKHATVVQQHPANPRQPSTSLATCDATAVQQALEELCNSGQAQEKLRVARTRKCNVQLGGITAHRLLPDLIAAINRCCDVRGDNDANRAALISESAYLSPREQADMREHFDEETIRLNAGRTA